VAISSQMNNNRLSSKVTNPLGTNLISSSAAGTIGQRLSPFFTDSCPAVQRRKAKSADFEFRTVEINTEKIINYNLLLEKIKDLLSRPSNFLKRERVMLQQKLRFMLKRVYCFILLII